tara:strand:- start:278 stop:574 length:297 start_codon:yes stop_codon:yes gene_type:complete
MSLDHAAIRKAYPNVVIVDDGAGAFDSSNNSVTLEQSKVDAARVAIDAEKAAVKYKTERADSFASIGDQLDMQYWDAINGTTTWKDHVAKVKSDNPKP